MIYARAWPLLSGLACITSIQAAVFQRNAQPAPADTTQLAAEVEKSTITVAELFVEHETWVPCTQTRTTGGITHTTTFSTLSTATHITSSTLSVPSTCSAGGCSTTRVSTMVANSSTLVVISGTHTVPLFSLTTATTVTLQGQTMTISPVYWSTPSSVVYWSTPTPSSSTKTASTSSATSTSKTASTTPGTSATSKTTSTSPAAGTSSATSRAQSASSSKSGGVSTVASQHSSNSLSSTFSTSSSTRITAKSSTSGVSKVSYSTNSLGQTVLSGSVSGVHITLPTGLSSVTTITTAGETLTFSPSNVGASSVVGLSTSVNSAGQTVLSESGVLVTLPTGLSSATTIITGGETLTFVPSSAIATSIVGVSTGVNSAGQTVLSESGILVTLPTGLSSATTIVTGGDTLTFEPSSPSPTHDSASSTLVTKSSSVIVALTTTNSQGQTVVSNSDGIITLPTGISTPIVTTEPDGVSTTITPAETQLTTTNSAGLTIISNSDGQITLPTGITTPILTTEPNGATVTITPAPSLPSGTSATGTSSSGVALLIPISTSVSAPTPTDGGTKIPCNLWFFDLCLEWKGTDIFGWLLDLPKGVRPPGPPPSISIPPGLHLTISVKGTLPPWPAITVGSDGIPTYSKEPSDCETQTAELCATQTSYGVSTSGTVATTTGSQVLSTCATVTGCVQGSSTSSTITGSCTATSTVTDVWLSCPVSATDTASCRTTSTSAASGCAVTATTVTCGLLTPTGIVQDPACGGDTGSPRVVFPASATDTAQIQAIAAELQDYVTDPDDIYNVTAGDAGFMFWGLNLTDNQVTNVTKIANVAAVYDDCADECTVDLSTDLKFVDLTPIDTDLGSWPRTQLGYVSWPPEDVNPNPNLNQYWFDDSLGGGVDVYIVDTGATLSHPEFTTASGRARWLPTNVIQGDGWNYHGTGMLSTVVGTNLGVAKNINPILARVGASHPTTPYGPFEWLRGVTEVNVDLGTADSAVTSAILLMATELPPSSFTTNDEEADPSTFVARLYGVLTAMVAKGVIPVTGSGNQNTNGINAWPQNFGKSGYALQIPELLVMGAVSADGTVRYGSYDTPGGLPEAYAPGVSITSANGNSGTWTSTGLYKTGTGTSQAAAHTAGLAAYFLGLIRRNQLFDSNGVAVQDSPQALKNFIIEKAWSRQTVDGAPRPGIWNLVDQLQPACSYNPTAPSRLFRRQASASGGGSCITPTATTRATSSTASAASTSINTSAAISAIVSILTGLTTTTPTPSSTASKISIVTSLLPTLTTTTGIVTPSGSSCIATSTITDCALGPNPSETACVTSPSCASFVSVAPLVTATPYCNPAGTFGNEPATDENTLDSDIDGFCASPALSVLASSGFNQQYTETNQGPGLPDQAYNYFVEWVDGCYLDGQDTQNVTWPIGLNGPNCSTILKDTYLDCNNGGIGGYIVAGCLRYDFYPDIVTTT